MVEVSVAFDRDERRIVLTETSKAGTAGRCDVCPPVGASKAPTSRDAYCDTAVDNWNQMGVGDQVEHAARPWSIDAANENVTIERGTEAFILNDTAVDFIDSK